MLERTFAVIGLLTVMTLLAVLLGGLLRWLEIRFVDAMRPRISQGEMKRLAQEGAELLHHGPEAVS